MSKGGDHEKVMVIQTCIDISWSGMKWMVNALSLNPGDELILVGLLHLINPPTLSLGTAAKILGYKGKEDPNKIFGSTRKVIEEELRRKKDEYRKNAGIMQLQKLYEIEYKVSCSLFAKAMVDSLPVKVSVEVAAGSSRKVAAVRAAKRLGATWIILDREMKKDKQYFMDRLSCGISSMKSNNTVVELRGPIIEHVSYDEMIPSYSWEDLSPSKSPGAQGTTSCKEISYSSRSLLADSQKDKSPCQALKSPRNDQNEACRTLKNPDLQYILNVGGSNGIDRNKMEEFENSICSVCKNRRPKVGLQRDFTYVELHEATKGFSKKNFLSEGGFGFVFKGKLKDGLKIAVKQHKAASLQGEKEFKSEVHVLSQARHQNLVVLLGSCTEGSHRLLVYEYVCNGSLEEHLSDDSPLPLNWEQRIKIAMGAAKGLAYLHAHNIVHRDMRPGNILITHDHESLLGDFGLAKAQQDDTAHSSGVVGTLGYVAPEYAESGKMSTKTDVYSFGVVLLQLITGLRTTDEIPGGKSLVGWAKPLLETKNYPDLIAKRILDSHDVYQLYLMVLVAEKCLKKDPDNRWTMEQVVHNLNCIKEGNTNFITDFSSTEWDSASTVLNS
ncbi:hypothetical protein DH2020_047107 [Rehmannia glutinosa]|uniref:Protein kinase domain-containing protein n=1 Tax=Rehmannia glutinosa TaxID=99300 RepID=A0ABR0UAD7_REHGL